MAIPVANLQLVTGNVSVAVGSSGSVTLTMNWQAYHLPTDTVVESGVESQSVNQVGDIGNGTKLLRVRCQTAYSAALAKHEARPEIDGLSLFDADLILDRWLFGPTGAEHPICGVHGITPNPASFTGMVNAVLGECLSPPMWAWADSVEAGKLRVKCVAVPGATSYSAFNGDTLLGNVPNLTNWVEVPVAAGSYTIRVAGVVGGQVGVLSQPITVEVT